MRQTVGCESAAEGSARRSLQFRGTPRSARRLMALAAGVVVVASACTSAPGAPALPSPPSPPVITRFAAIAPRTEAPVTVTLQWTISDPNGDPLSCRIDTDGDGSVDRTITNCDNADSVLVTYSGQGPWFPTLEVDDITTGSDQSTVEVRVDAGPSESFGITLSLASTMRPEFRAAFEEAATRWGQVIRAGLPDHDLTIPQDFLGWIPAFDGTVDDVLIAARDFDIDGPRGTLGRAGALLNRETGGQAYFGIMEFDTADLDRLATSGRLKSVILHEMGHVLGLGSNWALEGFVDDLLTDPKYNGAAGVTAWRELGGTGGVPLENEGGAGTAIGHWRETTFNNELMTGYSDGDERLSRLTVAGLADQGYGVDFSVADFYSLPTLPAVLRPSARAQSSASAAAEDVGHTDPVVPYASGVLPRT